MPTVHGNDNYKGASAKSGDGLMTVIKRRECYPTPCARDHHAGGPGANRAKGHMLQLSTLVQKLLPTPQARDCHSGTARPHGWAKSGKGTQHNLNDFVLRWPTPQSGDVKFGMNNNHAGRQQMLTTVVRDVIFDTPTVHGDGGSGRKGTMPKFGQLNPDWEEWLMFWPIGWTDIETPNIHLVWLDPSIDPADYGEIPRITNRRDNRPARVKEIGNGQFPLAASVAFFWGRAVLAAMCKSKKGTAKCS